MNTHSQTQLGAPPCAESAEMILAVVQAATVAESAVHGPARRIAFRTTRHLLAGAAQLGIPSSMIAAALGIRTDSVRSRSGVDGLVRGHDFAALANVPEGLVRKWERDGLIELAGPDRSGEYGYRASALLAAFTSPPAVAA